ncbi:hypothetical protein SAMN05421839_12537 [Halolactibacillus halophilus]|uniref:Fibronectin type III domain-containing protein n=1 Tax=Halolactibacillus halophilus TaxID=306540 RepID=A0A1I5QYC6_9BACI|nr:hypothetical protein [Halolactibacillus halophilus]GEM02000.1 hypothetical protein HHA03_15320 [Halolactibacillus halophilus]SFP51051.1 hypothetical protein SAMN05421839_12537 [Halolactibacillus halophilus]
MKKKVFVLILALFMLLPVSGVFASDYSYSNGLLNIKDVNVDGLNIIFDDNLNNYYTLTPRRYDFSNLSKPIKLNTGAVVQFEISIIGSNPKGWINFYADNSSLYKITLADLPSVNGKNQYIITRDLSNINRIRFGGENIRIHEMDFFDELQLTPPKDIENLTTIQTYLQASFTYDLPTDEDFSHVKIYQDDVLIADNVTDTSYTVKNLDYGGIYNFKFTTVDETGNESEGVTEKVTIATPELEEIKQVNAEASHDRVDLSWSLPETEYFEHVNIYRKKVSDVQTFSLLSVDEYDPLFETNGTYFNDLTVEEQTTYDYKLTTEFQGLESEGVTVQATTLVAPPPELGGQDFEEQENGDYLVTWQQPETGQVRILVDGQEYVVVPATDKQYTIPAAEMKYSALGDPLVGLQTIGDNGEESEVEQQESNVNLPFGINELLTTSAGLLRVIGSLILLGLSFILVPKFIKVIKQSLNNNNNAETEREQRVSERAYREPRETRISTREGRTSTRVQRDYRKGE